MKDTGHEIPDKHCSHEGCLNTYKPHHWGAVKANSEGWFLQKSGEAWCPNHVPEWVDNWRKNKS